MVHININRAKIFKVLVALSLFFSLLNLALLVSVPTFNASTFIGPLSLFNMNAEISVPTWYAQIILLASSSLFFINGLFSNSKKYWYGLAGIFLFLSIDEGASIHELLTTPLRDLLNISSGIFYYSWFIVYGLGFLILGVLYFNFFNKLESSVKILMFISVVLFISGSIVLESIGGSIISASNTEANFLYSLVTIFEETLELLGVSILLNALLLRLSLTKSSFKIKFN